VKAVRLTDQEFRAMNNPLRRFFQRRVEFPVFEWLGLRQRGLDVLEVGCGSGYGAVLVGRLQPRSYVGIDIMPEQIELARKQAGSVGAEFLVMDAADMRAFPDASKDGVVIFDILHHIVKWRDVIRECHRVLRPGGKMYLEEPAGGAVRLWDMIFKWNHPQEALFSRKELEDHVREVGFTIVGRVGILAFVSYCVQKEGMTNA
jgi:ubiquinone/menaquinone biosynthesis C-methylase UbiE